MQLEHSFTVPVGVADAWQVLLDIERIAPCMPGAAIDTVDGDDFTGTVKVKLGPIGLTYKGKASFVEKDEAARRVTINAQGRDARGNGTAAARVTATLSAAGDGTKVDVLTDLDITGKPAQFGRGVMVDVGNKLIGQFADCLAGKLAEGTSGGATTSAAAAKAPAKKTSAAKAAPAKKTTTAKAAPAKKTTTAKAAPAKTPAKTPAKAAKTAAKTAAKAAPAPAVPAEPGEQAEHAEPAPAPAPAPAEVEPINLLESAGPAVAKRAVPVVVALIVLVFIVLRVRRR